MSYFIVLPKDIGIQMVDDNNPSSMDIAATALMSKFQAGAATSDLRHPVLRAPVFVP